MFKISDITLIKKLGNCTFGEIYLSNKDGMKEFFATKVIGRNYIDNQFKECFFNEIKILKELSNRNICRVFDIKETKDHYYIVMEYINGGSLSDCLANYKCKHNTSFSEEIVQHLMRQIISAFKFIHSKHIIHRNINLDNIMVNFGNKKCVEELNLLNAEIKIMNFSFAIKGESSKIILGDPLTMDPYLLMKLAGLENRELVYDNKIDIWSLGVICYEMLTGKSFYYAQSLDELAKKVKNGYYTIPKKLSLEAVSFLNYMLQFSSKNRLSAEQLENQPFLTKKFKEFHLLDTNIYDCKGLVPEIIINQLNFNEKEEIILNTKAEKSQLIKLISENKTTQIYPKQTETYYNNMTNNFNNNNQRDIGITNQNTNSIIKDEHSIHGNSHINDDGINNNFFSNKNGHKIKLGRKKKKENSKDDDDGCEPCFII